VTASNVFDDVRKFHEAFDLPRPAELVHEADPELIQLRIKLTTEEVNDELVPALVQFQHAPSDALMVAIADGIIDSIYVLVGCGISLGIPLQKAWDEVQRCNMAKLGPDGKPIRRADGKVLKPEGWLPPDMYKVLGLRDPLSVDAEVPVVEDHLPGCGVEARGCVVGCPIYSPIPLDKSERFVPLCAHCTAPIKPTEATYVDDTGENFYHGTCWFGTRCAYCKKPLAMEPSTRDGNSDDVYHDLCWSRARYPAEDRRFVFCGSVEEKTEQLDVIEGMGWRLMFQDREHLLAKDNGVPVYGTFRKVVR